MALTIEELSIEQIHAAFTSGELSSRQLVEHYLRRISEYDRGGPMINSMVTLNRNVLSEADKLDRMLSETWMLRGPLHGIPFLIKDQIETAGIRTTFGSRAFENYIPDEDATVVKRIKAAGGLIIGKANMPDFGVSWFGVSSISGHTLNPYDTERDPGGSSSGIGAGISANFATVGIGEDTAGSIRVPSSFNNLYGIRVTTGLISRNGMAPIISFQDTAGPMGKSVRDIAAVLEVIAGYDQSDGATSVCTIRGADNSYLKALSPGNLGSYRIGILSSPMFNDTDQRINDIMGRTVELLKKKGVTMRDDVEVQNLAEWISRTSLYDVQAKKDINGFIGTRKGSPYKSLEKIISTGTYSELVDILPSIAEGDLEPVNDPTYYERRFNRTEFRELLVQTMSVHGLDALMYPSVRILPPEKMDIVSGKWKGMAYPTNSLIASHSDCPAISMPAGFTEEGLPVGIELLGRPFSEHTLLDISYSFELIADTRRLPTSTPPI